MPNSSSQDRWFIPRQLAGLALDYLRWTQFLPMLAGWAFFGLMIAALALINFQDVAMPMTERALLLAERLFGPFDDTGFGQTDAAGGSTTPGSVRPMPRAHCISLMRTFCRGSIGPGPCSRWSAGCWA
ncbi:MAG: hypothetical protein CVV18_05195 [Gammaproteobacteria bacterium HGW-Gammaproteobacteria-8]|nr:MAG: hypothetical protein CVV18_05195 [Gammaproteobacteria bacterium HGW-Gammaproteobacteria-8]